MVATINFKKSKKTLHYAIYFLAIISTALQVSCSQNSKSENIILASKGKIASLDPAQANKLIVNQLISALGDTLYEINSNGELEPKLAKELPIISKDGLEISIPLKENILFHDGSQFDSYAMAFSLKRFQKIGTLNYIIDNRIKSIETPEKFLLRIILNRPSSSLSGLLTSINLTPISPNAYSQYKDNFLNNNFIGTGPYKLESFTPERVVLKPFNNYWGEKVRNNGISYINLNTSTSLFNAIKTGQIDILLSNSVEDGHRVALTKLSQKGILLEREGPAMQIGYIAFKSNSQILRNKDIRNGLKYSIDRKLISKQVSYGTRGILRTLTPPILGLKNDSPWPKYDSNLSQEFFKKAGFCKNKKINLPLTFRSNVPADKLLALTWQEQVKRDLSNCLEISINGVESTTVYKQLSEGAYEAVILGWTGEYPDPYAYLSPLLDCKKIINEICEEGEAVFGGTFWANNNLQKALEKTEVLYGSKRLEEFQKIEKIAKEGASLLPVWLVKPKAWTQKNIQQTQFDNSGRLFLKKIIKAYE